MASKYKQSLTDLVKRGVPKDFIKRDVLDALTQHPTVHIYYEPISDVFYTSANPPYPNEFSYVKHCGSIKRKKGAIRV